MKVGSNGYPDCPYWGPTSYACTGNQFSHESDRTLAPKRVGLSFRPDLQLDLNMGGRPLLYWTGSRFGSDSGMNRVARLSHTKGISLLFFLTSPLSRQRGRESPSKPQPPPPPSCRSGEPTPPQRSPLLLYSFPRRQPRRKWSERLENEPPSAPCRSRISLVRRWIATAPRYVILCASTIPFTVGIRREMIRSPEIPKADNGRTSPPIYATHRWIGLDSLLDAPIAGDAKAEGEVGDGSGSGLRRLLAVGGCEWFDGRLGEGGAWVLDGGLWWLVSVRGRIDEEMQRRVNVVTLVNDAESSTVIWSFVSNVTKS
ncbi:hypothetical protein GQ457_11G020110 [Hibiscus cannabinus]